ncbi:specifically androgen-regulated gene protein [Mantella aurantiaca]
MPEKFFTRHVGMEAMNSVGSTGSCDSIESITSNHSAFSGEGYDHLSAEERECLMFLEETIESIDNEDDSGLSNDEVETTNKVDNLMVSEPMKIPFSASNEKISPKVASLPKLEEWTNAAFDLNAISQGHHSFPRVQVCKVESTKQPFDYKIDGPKKDQLNMWPEKPKRMSSISKQHKEESHISEFLILPPPKAFRDPQIVDKRHSVTDPTDSREVRFDRLVLKSAVISEHKDASAKLKQADPNLPMPVYPRVSSPNISLIGEQETLNQAIERHAETQFKQGPPTAPKPRTLPPHIIIKTTRGDIPNLDPQRRPRTFSAHERSTDKTNGAMITNVLHSKEQERARQEALKKLGLEKKSSSQENNSIPSSKMELPTGAFRSKQVKNEDKRKSVVIDQQEETNSSRSIPILPLVPQKTATDLKNEVPARNRLSVKSNLFEKPDESTNSIPFVNRKEIHIPGHGPVNSDIIVKTKYSEKTNTREKLDERTTLSLTITDVHEVTDHSKNVKFESHRNALQLHPGPQRKDNVTDETVPVQSSTVPEKNPVIGKSFEHLTEHFQVSIAQENKTGSLENINLIGTSPRNHSSFSPPKEPLATQHSPKIIHNDDKGRTPVVQSNRHSTHFDPSDEPYLRLPQSSVPGLRQISIKSNTLERSGVGLSSSLSSIEKGSNSFFKKPIFSGNFLRNNRPRPASLGTGKDFANLEPSTATADSTEKHSFFSRPSRQSAPVTSVKIAPKGSTDEHRRQALQKLGILKE